MDRTSSSPCSRFQMHLPIEAALWIAMWRTFKLGHYQAVGKYVELQGGRAPGRQDGRMSSKRGAVSGPSPHHPKSLP